MNVPCFWYKNLRNSCHLKKLSEIRLRNLGEFFLHLCFWPLPYTELITTSPLLQFKNFSKGSWYSYWLTQKWQKQPPEVFCKKRCSSSTLLKKRLWHRCFPVNFVEISKSNFFAEQLRATASKVNLFHLRKLGGSTCSKKKFSTKKSTHLAHFLRREISG